LFTPRRARVVTGAGQHIAERDTLYDICAMMYLVRQFRDGELRQSEALAAFSIIIFLKRIPLWQTDRQKKNM